MSLLRMPNLPGSKVHPDSWASRSSKGFKRTTGTITGNVWEKAAVTVTPGTVNFGRTKPANNNDPIVDEFAARPTTAGGAATSTRNGSKFMLDLLRPQTADSSMYKTPDAVTYSPVIPKFVQTDKIVLRFYGFFLDERVYDMNAPLGSNFLEKQIVRYLTIYYYVGNMTIAMNEPKSVNSGMSGGTFLRRTPVKKSDGSLMRPLDLEVGKTIFVVGREIFITDADTSTREYIKREYGIILHPPIQRPETARDDLGALYATGLASHIPPKIDNHGSCSTDYQVTKAGLLKTQKFLMHDGHVLRFMCVETKSPYDDKIVDNAKRYLLSFFMSDDSIEIRMMKNQRSSLDDAMTLLKRSKLPINWREVQSSGGGSPVYYAVEDLICGNIIECYGRFLLLIDCEENTKRYYEEKGIEQIEIQVATAQTKQIPQNIMPKAGENFLSIGSEEDNMATVFGAPKALKDWDKIEQNQTKILRAKLRMVTDNPVDKTRSFLLSMYLVDNSLMIFEEQRPNSGIVGGSFLKRGKFMNSLPPDSDSPRYFIPTDLYLGNIISVNSTQFQIVEMDALSMTIMEDKPEDFPLFDPFNICTRLLPRVANLRTDLRSILSSSKVDKFGSNWLSKETLLQVLEGLHVTRGLNDQELLTLCRRVKDKSAEKYFYHELCDLFSYIFYVDGMGGNDTKFSADYPEKHSFLQNLRGRRCQWRRTIRRDPRSKDGIVTLTTLLSIFRRNGVNITDENKQIILEDYIADEIRTSNVDGHDGRVFFDATVNSSYNGIAQTKAAATDLDAQQLRSLALPDVRVKSNVKRSEIVGRAVDWRVTGTDDSYKQESKSLPKTTDVQTMRENSMQPLLRKKVTQDQRASLGLLDAPESDSVTSKPMFNKGDDEGAIFIDYNSLCNDIYPSISGN